MYSTVSILGYFLIGVALSGLLGVGVVEVHCCLYFYLFIYLFVGGGLIVAVVVIVPLLF